MKTLVHRSVDPGVLEAYRTADQRWKRWQRQVRAWADHHQVPARIQVSAAGSVVGIRIEVDAPVPPGWRRDPRAAIPMIVPNMRSHQGKALALELGRLRRPADVRAALPGIPDGALINRRRVTYTLQVHHGALYAVWAEPVPSIIAQQPLWRPLSMDAYKAATKTSAAS